MWLSRIGAAAIRISSNKTPKKCIAKIDFYNFVLHFTTQCDIIECGIILTQNPRTGSRIREFAAPGTRPPPFLRSRQTPKISYATETKTFHSQTIQFTVRKDAPDEP